MTIQQSSLGNNEKLEICKKCEFFKLYKEYVKSYKVDGIKCWKCNCSLISLEHGKCPENKW